jgi:hypothetical protein
MDLKYIGNAIVGLMLCFVLMGVGGFLYTNWRINTSIQSNNKPLCDVAVAINSPGPGVPSPIPGTRAYEISKRLSRLSKAYRCQ